MKKNTSNKKRSRKVLTKAQRRRGRRERQKRKLEGKSERYSDRQHHNVVDLQKFKDKKERMGKVNESFDEFVKDIGSSIDDDFFDPSKWGTYWVTGIVGVMSKTNTKVVYRFPVKAPSCPSEHNEDILPSINMYAVSGIHSIMGKRLLDADNFPKDMDSYFVDTEEDMKTRWDLMKTLPPKKWMKYNQSAIVRQDEARESYNGKDAVVVIDKDSPLKSLGKWKQVFTSQSARTGGWSAEQAGEHAAMKYLGQVVPLEALVADGEMYIQEFVGSKLKRTSKVVFDAATEYKENKERYAYK